jgi:hypothetical protein
MITFHGGIYRMHRTGDAAYGRARFAALAAGKVTAEYVRENSHPAY